MVTVSRVMKTSPDRVWSVLADGWLYPLWVVGASRIREVDESWPKPGSRIHHSVGLWPALLDDETQVVDAVPSESLRLRARGWPIGEADVDLRLTATAGGTRVELEEDIVSGPALVVPKPVRAPMIMWRNNETLRRLAYLAERRTRDHA